MAEPHLGNAVRVHRERLGLTQAALARRVGLSRQALHSLETARSVPSVRVSLELARELQTPVERLFWLPGAQAKLRARLDGSADAGGDPRRVLLADVEGEVVAHLLDSTSGTPADGLGTPSGDGTMEVELLPGCAWRERLVLAGCDPALGLLAQRVGAGAHWLDVPRDEALTLPARRRTHVAGFHLTGDEGPGGNVRAVRTRRFGRPLSVVHFASWELGLAVAAGNPLGIREVSSLASPRVRLVNRGPTAAARHLLDRLLKRARVPRARVRGYDSEAPGHAAVALAISLGGADAGVTTRAAAEAHGLEFLPLSREHFDLVFPAAADDAPVQRMLDVLRSESFRRELGALPGYDAAHTGDAVAEVG
jgi:putative molybdopterin biosynthesis protein